MSSRNTIAHARQADTAARRLGEVTVSGGNSPVSAGSILREALEAGRSAPVERRGRKTQPTADAVSTATSVATSAPLKRKGKVKLTTAQAQEAKDTKTKPLVLKAVDRHVVDRDASHKIVFLHEVRASQRLFFRHLAEARGWKLDTKPKTTFTDKDVLALLARDDNPAYRIPTQTMLATVNTYNHDDDRLLEGIVDRIDGRTTQYVMALLNDYESDDSVARLRHGGYLLAIPASATGDRDTVRQMENVFGGDFVDYPHLTIIHGVMIEHIHYHFDDKDAVDEMNGRFVDLSLPAVRAGRKTRPVRRDTFADETANATSNESREISWALTQRPPTTMNNGAPFRHGYIVVSPEVVFTTFPSQEDFDAAIKALNVQPVEATGEAAFVQKWGGTINDGLVQHGRELDRDLDRLRMKIVTIQQQKANLDRTVALASADAMQTMERNLARIKAAGEVASLSLTENVLTVITNPMLAINASTEEERYCGRFEIQIHFTGVVRMRNCASPNRTYRNPHGECVGSFSTVFESAMASRDYHQLVISAMEYYRTFDRSHTDRWDCLPESKEASARTFVSSWQNIVGTWPDLTVYRSKNSLRRKVQQAKMSKEMAAFIDAVKASDSDDAESVNEAVADDGL